MILQDKRAIFQVIGCLLKEPMILYNTNKYNLNADDFPERFHKIIFSTILELFNQGNKEIDYVLIDNFLSSYEVQYKIFNDNNGIEYLLSALENCNLSSFDYNYLRIKKFSLLRSYKENGIDISEVYDETLISPKEQEEMQEQFNKYTLEDIVAIVDKRHMQVKEKFLLSYGSYGQHAGKNLKELKEEFKEEPEVGVPLCSGILNSITRGARLKKLYMRSMPQGSGKSRLSLGDACNLTVKEFFDIEKKQWITNGTSEPVLFITTELEMDEVQTPLIAFVSGVNEDKILDANYTKEEEARVDKAIDIIQESPFWIEHVPNFNIADIEQTIQRYVLYEGVKYIFFDYVHTSIKLLAELSSQSRGMKLREDNVLLMFVDRLKALCNSLGVFIYTATQVSK